MGVEAKPTVLPSANERKMSCFICARANAHSQRRNEGGGKRLAVACEMRAQGSGCLC